MQLETVIRKIIKFVNTRLQALSISITSGGIDNMEKYKAFDEESDSQVENNPTSSGQNLVSLIVASENS